MFNPLNARECRARIMWAALMLLFAACTSDEPLSPAATRYGAPSRDLVVTDPVGVERVTNRFAYLWAHEEHAASYIPMPEYSFNASGGAIQITHLTTGSYRVNIDGVVTPTDHKIGLSVVAYGATTFGCAVKFPLRYDDTQLQVLVDCYDRVTHVPVDTRFSLLAVGDQSVPGRSAFAKIHDNYPGPPSYAPDSTTSFTTGDSILVGYNDPANLGDLNVRFGTGTATGTTVLVTVGTANDQPWPPLRMSSCMIGGWLSSSVDVHCFDSNGEPYFQDAYILQLERGRAGRRMGFALANQPTVDSYTPTAAHSYNSSGYPITVTRTAIGRYTVEFMGLTKYLGHSENVQVTPVVGGTPAACKVVKWVNSAAMNSLLVLVECRTIPSGAYRDAKFNVVVIE